MAGQAVSGQNPLTGQSLKESGENAGVAGGSDLLLGSLPWLAQSKLGRGMINESVGAAARDVTYGNPAKALLNEGINSPLTGDIEKYKVALRSGAPPNQALVKAGGRMGAVSARINQLAPQLNATLGASQTPIAVADVIDKPLQDAASQIIGNRAMTTTEKDTAISQLGALQQSLKEGLGQYISPLEANQIKQQIGDRVNWGGNISVTDEVKPAYRSVYGALKNAVNSAVPEASGLNERLTDLLAAQGDLKKLMGMEEVGQGRGALGSAVTGIARRAEAVGGRLIPGAAATSRGARRVVPPFLAGAFRPTIYSDGNQ